MPLRKSHRTARTPLAVAALAALAMATTASAAEARSSTSTLSSLLSGLSSQKVSTSSGGSPLSNATSALSTATGSAVSTITSGTATAPKIEAASNACPVQPVVKAFSRFGDQADYSLAPGGNFESGSAGWTLVGGAKVASGNESLGVSSGSRSLQLPAGSVAISPPFCVDQTNPHFRFVQRNDGKLSGYQAIVLYRDAAGKLAQAQFTSSQSSSVLTSAWGPSTMSPLATRIPLLSSAPTASVQLMFVSLNMTSLSGLLPSKYGTVSIDSVMVDPYRRG